MSGVDLFGAKQSHEEESPQTSTTTSKQQSKSKPLQKEILKEQKLTEQKAQKVQKVLKEAKETKEQKEVKSKKPKPVMFTTPPKTTSPPAIGYHTFEPAQRSYRTSFDDSDDEPTRYSFSLHIFKIEKYRKVR